MGRAEDDKRVVLGSRRTSHSRKLLQVVGLGAEDSVTLGHALSHKCRGSRE